MKLNVKRDDNIEPVFTLDGHVTAKEAKEMFAKALKELEEKEKQEKMKEQNKKS